MSSRQTLSREAAPARDRYATRQEVAAYLHVPIATLQRWAYRRIGPPYKIIGRHARYSWSDVEHWVKDQQGGGAVLGGSG